MVAVGSWHFFAGIGLTQADDPLAHRQWGNFHLISLNTLVALASLLVAVSEDQEVGELGFGVKDITEGWRDVVARAKVFPAFEDVVLGALMLGGGAGRRELERRAEISLEAMCVGRCSSRHGRSCGYRC